jgi:hypothetical protein
MQLAVFVGDAFSVSERQELAAKQKPPTHQGGGFHWPWRIFVSAISRRTSNQKHSFLIQGTLPLHRRLPDLLSEVIPDVP